MRDTKIMKLLAGIATLAAAAFVAVVPVKADAISDATASFEREKAYLQSVNPSLIPAAEADFAKEIATLTAIKNSTIAAAEALDVAVQADYARGVAMLDAIEASTAAAAKVRDAQAVAGLQRGAAYLNDINQRTIAAQNARNAAIAAAAQKEIAYLNSVNPALVPAAQADLDKEMAWMAGIDARTVASAAVRDAAAAAGAQGGLWYLNYINEKTAAAWPVLKAQGASGFERGYASLQAIHATIGAK